MSELHFKGKEFVYNHHLSVPYRPLVADTAKSIGEGGLNGNIIIHGDNLHALKALMPRYTGKVDCIFIDPPYNTGNEGWCYNDNVNSPMMQEWLKSSPVGLEDGLRHDKWCAMMWPRLKLLHELLSEKGSFWMTLDDNEVQRGRALCDAIFGDASFKHCFIWRKVDSPNDNKVAVTADHDYLLCYVKDPELIRFSPMMAPGILDAYSKRDELGRLYRDRLLKKNGKNSLRKDRPSMYFPISDPDGNAVFPIHDNGEDACWAAGQKAIDEHIKNGTLIWKKRKKLGAEGWEPYTREYAPETPTRPYPTIWSDLATMRQAKANQRDIFGTADLFDTPKPSELIERILELVDLPDAVVLDSFAGSGTTAHAVLKANLKDGGNRHFILIECEDYADRLTAERVRRVISGYEFKGTQKEELLNEKISFTKFKKAAEIIHQIDGIENTESHRFDSISKTIQDGVLVVEGIKKITERKAGLGGEFTYCTLGDPIDIDKILTGESMPDYHSLGSWLFHTATGASLDTSKVDEPSYFLGETDAYYVWLLYKPDLGYLKSKDAALTLSLAEKISLSKEGKKHLVFAAAKFASNKALLPLGVEFAPLPFALYQVER